RGQRRRYPARLERVARVTPRAHLVQPELPAGLDDRRAYGFTVFPRSEQLPSGLADHAVPKRAHVAAGDREAAHVEEADLRHRFAGGRPHYLRRVRTLHLKAIDLAYRRFAVLVDGAFVAVEPHVVVAGLGVILNPVVDRGAPDQIEAILLEMKQND